MERVGNDHFHLENKSTITIIVVTLIYSPMVIVMHVNRLEVTKVKTMLSSIKIRKTVHVILHIVQTANLRAHKYTFPVNHLRNIGIRHVVTSHFLVLDMDGWPARM